MNIKSKTSSNAILLDNMNYVYILNKCSFKLVYFLINWQIIYSCSFKLVHLMNKTTKKKITFIVKIDSLFKCLNKN